MNLLRVILIPICFFITASCSEKSDSDRNKKLGNEQGKPLAELTPQRSPSDVLSASGENAGQTATETDAEPDAYDIGEDCVAFLRATKTIAHIRENGDCPQCPVSEATHEVIKFDHMQVDRVALSGATCVVTVKILATFNPSTGETIGGGLAGWIAPEQRLAYSHGETPSGQQVYKVNITYRRTDNAWRAIEFDKANPE